jgi:uncharacterized protein (TIGR03083 family)
VRNVSEPPDLAGLYHEARGRIVELVATVPDPAAVPVAACPGWSARDLVAHLLGVTEDRLARNMPPSGAAPDWTAAQLARTADLSVGELLDRWDTMAPSFEAVLTAESWVPGVIDVAAHEHDLRAAVGEPGPRDDDAVRFAAPALLQFLDVPAPLVVRTEDGDVRVGPGDGEPTVLTTTRFDAFRWRLGRRSRAQMAAFEWSADPEPFLDHLVLFGPAEQDVIE